MASKAVIRRDNGGHLSARVEERLRFAEDISAQPV